MQSSQYSRGFSPPTSSDSLRCTTRTMSSSSCRSSFLCSPRFRFQVCHVEHRFQSSGSQPICTHLSNPYQPFTPSANNRNHHAYLYASPFYPMFQLVLAMPCYGRQRTHHPEAFQLPSSCCPKSGHKRYCSHNSAELPKKQARSGMAPREREPFSYPARSRITSAGCPQVNDNCVNKTFKTFPLVHSA